MERPCRTIATACVVLGLASASTAGQVRFEIRDGLVTLHASEATVREICAEWARVGQTRIVNAEQASSRPLTLQLDGVPERQALDIVLRSIAGFVAAPRTSGQQATTSVFESILLMPQPRPTAAPAPVSSQIQRPASPTQFPIAPRQAPAARTPATFADDEDDEVPTVQMPLPGQTGAMQPGMLTPAPPNRQQNPQGVPQNPMGIQYPAGSPASGDTPGMAPGPQSAPFPGMPTAPPAPTRPGVPTGPIK